jgi:phosphoribosylformylglycinamidine (FGAM) synthase-like amidotransferase family enzyme
MRVGIIGYLGSNCDNDILEYFENSIYIRHKKDITTSGIVDINATGAGITLDAAGTSNFTTTSGTLTLDSAGGVNIIGKIDLLVISGEFAYYIDPEKMEIASSIKTLILEAVKNKILIFGISNGFKVLIKLGLLPGEILMNLEKRYTLEKVKCILDKSFISQNNDKQVELLIANKYGRYFINSENYITLKNNNQIILTYSDENWYNNGSVSNVAGVCDETHMIFGMMPHPEVTREQLIKEAFVKL